MDAEDGATIGPPEAQVQPRGEGAAAVTDPERERRAEAQPPPAQDEDWGEGPPQWLTRLPTWIAVAAVSLMAFGLLWIGGEMHYRNCLDAAELRAPDANDNLSRLVRTQALEKCSRSPF